MQPPDEPAELFPKWLSNLLTAVVLCATAAWGREREGERPRQDVETTKTRLVSAHVTARWLRSLRWHVERGRLNNKVHFFQSPSNLPILAPSLHSCGGGRIESAMSLTLPLMLAPSTPSAITAIPLALSLLGAQPKVTTALPYPRPSCRKSSQIC